MSLIWFRISYLLHSYYQGASRCPVIYSVNSAVQPFSDQQRTYIAVSCIMRFRLRWIVVTRCPVVSNSISIPHSSSAWREWDTLQRLQNKAKIQLCLPTSFPGSFILLGEGDERPWERRRCACIERPCERGSCMCLPGDIVNRNRKSLICYNLSVVM